MIAFERTGPVLFWITSVKSHDVSTWLMLLEKH